jgi:hypothetical protein
MAGWMRLGWGKPALAAPTPPPPPPARPFVRAPGLALDCEPMGPKPSAEGIAPPPSRPGAPLPPPRMFGPRGPSRLFSATPTWTAVSQFLPFAGRTPPAIPEGDLGLSLDGAMHPFERGLFARAMARVYTWGPAAGDWDPPGRWQVRWLWPWQGPYDPAPVDAHSSGVGTAPWVSLDQAMHVVSNGYTIPQWTFLPGDDTDHALLAERRSGQMAQPVPQAAVALVLLDADRAPVEVHRAGGELLPDVQGAVRSGGRWYVSTAQPPGEPSATVVWVLDGAVAREVGRVPRVAPEAGGPAVLVRRVGGVVGPAAGGSANPIGLLVVGQGPGLATSYWVSTFDPDTHAFGDPEPLAPYNLSDRPGACSSDDAGWELALPPAFVDVRAGTWRARLEAALARLRVSRTGACVDRVLGSADASAASADGTRTLDAIWAPRGAPADAASVASAHVVAATVLTEGPRVRLRCRVVSP